MKIHSLHSSSSGNSLKISTKKSTIVIDAGVSYKKLCEANGCTFDKLDAVFITHDHGDHVGGAGVLGRKTGAPIYIHRKSYTVRKTIFKDCDIREIDVGDTVEIGDLSIKPFSNKHDAEYCMSYIVTHLETGKKFGYTTDTGMITPMMAANLKGCDAYLIEANYDVQMMEDYEDYDQIHKDRVTSPLGHLSNDQTREFIRDHLNLDDIQFILLGHLSPRTNSEEIIEEQFTKEFGNLDKFIFSPTVDPITIK